MKFDKLMLLANGWVVYFNDAMKSAWYFQLMGYPVPNLMNPADHYLSITSIEALEDELLDQSIDQEDIPWDDLERKYEHKIEVYKGQAKAFLESGKKKEARVKME